MRIAIIDPFFDESHKIWTQGLIKYSSHQYELITLGPHHWKWKMAAGALYCAQMINAYENPFDLLLATDMVNVPLLKAQLTPHHIATPIALYFHENQITYPWSEDDEDIKEKRDYHYGWMNYTSVLTAGRIFFNSSYHYESFFGSLPNFLKRFPELPIDLPIDQLKSKSQVLPIGMDYPKDLKRSTDSLPPVVLWNHRWENDKNPLEFFETLKQIQRMGIEFRLIVCGKSFKEYPAIFDEAKKIFHNELIHFGYAHSIVDYHQLLGQSDVILATSWQDFFGISIVEAIYSGSYPILPNRLAYPEHIPEMIRNDHIYNDKEQMIKLLTKVLLNKKNQNAVALKHHVDKYAWARCIEDYDEAFSLLLQKSSL
jgi:glycosyltransferase involved in cell wall biosynthesis